MLKEHRYKVAQYTFTVALPLECDPQHLLPSFTPFVADDDNDNTPLFRFTAEAGTQFQVQGTPFEESRNDLGHMRLYRHDKGYTIALRYTHSGPQHLLHAPATFASAHAQLHTADPYLSQVLDSMLRMVFSLAILPHGGISIHASAVTLDGRAYLFLGKSGTGKSTHASLWQRHFKGCELLNDDNPVIRVCGNDTYVYGTPWSGKTPCYRNLCYPLGGIARLQQAPSNSFVRNDEADAFATLLPGCSAIRSDHTMSNALYDTLAHIAATVPVGHLRCLPDTEAANLCSQSLIQTT